MQSFVKVTLTTIGLVLILIGVIGVLMLTQAQNMWCSLSCVTFFQIPWRTRGRAPQEKQLS